jgi:hypothetical protein
MYHSDRQPNSQGQSYKKEFVLRAWGMGYNLIPLSGKFPPCTPWKRYQTERVTPEGIVAWGKNQFTRKNGGTFSVPILNFALLTGVKPYSDAPALVVVDPDNDEAEALVRSRCPETPVRQQTGRGGWHHVYRRPPVEAHAYIPNRQKTWIDGKQYDLDIRADGGYIVAPGSEHPDTHRIYTEVTPWTVELVAQAPVYDPAWLPCEGERNEPPPPQVYRYRDDPLDGDELTLRQEMAWEWLRERPCSVQGEGADNQCFRYAMCLTHGFGLLPEEALPVFLRWGQRPGHVDKHGGYYAWTRQELTHKLSNAVQRPDYLGEGYLLPVDDSKISLYVPEFEAAPSANGRAGPRGADEIVEEVASTVLGERLKKPKTLEGWADLKARARDKPPVPLIDGLLFRGDTHFISSLPWVGKSTLVGPAIAAVCQGTPFLGRETKKGKVAFINSDLTPDDLVEARIRLGVTDEAAMYENYFQHCPDNLPAPMKVTDETNYLLDWLEKHGPFAWVVVDTFRTAFLAGAEKGVENDTAIIKYVQPFRVYGKRTGTTFSFLTHNNRTNDTMAGAAILQGCSDAIWVLHREEGSCVLDFHGKNRRTEFITLHIQQLESGELDLATAPQQDDKGEIKMSQFVALFGSFNEGGKTVEQVFKDNKVWFHANDWKSFPTAKVKAGEAKRRALLVENPQDAELPVNKPRRYYPKP